MSHASRRYSRRKSYAIQDEKKADPQVETKPEQIDEGVSAIETTKEEPPQQEKPEPEPIKVQTPEPPQVGSILRPINRGKFDVKHITWQRLHNALIAKKWDEAAWLVDQKCDIQTWRGILNETLLHEACMRKAPSDVIKAFLNRGADVHAKTTHGLTPLHSACLYNPSVVVIENLIVSGARIDERNVSGQARDSTLAY